MPKRFTAFYVFSDAKSIELRASGRQRVTTNEIIEYWRNLSDAERRPYEEKAAQHCSAYMEECTQRERQRMADGDANDGGEGEEDEVDDADGEGGDGDAEGGKGEAALHFPVSRVKKVITQGLEMPRNFGRESIFAVTKSVEFFLERCVWDAARVTAREGRKTLSFKDVVTSMRQHPCPESMQFFVEEFQPKPDPPEPKKPASKGTNKGKPPAKGTAKAAGKRKAEGGSDDGKPAKQPKAAAPAEAPPPEDAPANASLRTGMRRR